MLICLTLDFAFRWTRMRDIAQIMISPPSGLDFPTSQTDYLK